MLLNIPLLFKRINITVTTTASTSASEPSDADDEHDEQEQEPESEPLDPLCAPSGQPLPSLSPRSSSLASPSPAAAYRRVPASQAKLQNATINNRKRHSYTPDSRAGISTTNPTSKRKGLFNLGGYVNKSALSLPLLNFASPSTGVARSATLPLEQGEDALPHPPAAPPRSVSSLSGHLKLSKRSSTRHASSASKLKAPRLGRRSLSYNLDSLTATFTAKTPAPAKYGSTPPLTCCSKEVAEDPCKCTAAHLSQHPFCAESAYPDAVLAVLLW